MSRVSKTQTDKNRATIELVASQLFRQHGLNGISVADLMGAAGLTHGGFYGHFASKDVLAAIACEQAFAQSAARWQHEISAATPPTAFAAVAAGYLTNAHRDDPGHGCAMTALATDVARESADKPVHAAYIAGVKRLLAQLVEALPEPAHNDARAEQAMMQLALLVGSMILARATIGDPLSDAFLTAARAHINATEYQQG
jgi:TetR/AcrR family transcriptional repressor of nem operon